MGKGSSKNQTIGFRYYMSLLSGLCRGPIDEMVEIKVGDESAWNGHACSIADTEYINAPDLFGGDKKEGGIQGPFAIFQGRRNQVLPGDRTYDGTKLPGGVLGGSNITGNVLEKIFNFKFANRKLPDVKASIGGLVPEMRGVVMVWYDGLVSAMNPYLKEWKFRVRRSQQGWYGGKAWYAAKATIWLGGTLLTLASSKPIGMAVDETAGTITFTALPVAGDSITINGQKVTFVASVKDQDPGRYEIVIPKKWQTAGAASLVAKKINSLVGAYKASATAAGNVLTLKTDKNSTTISAMNAAHIVYECFTNPEWGRGWKPEQMIDEPSFIATANTLCAERFGLAIIWYRKEDIDVFVKKVADLVGGVVYTDRESGKMVFKLIRNDYNIEDVPLFTPETGLVSINDDDSASSESNYNEIIGTSLDPVTNQEFQRRAQNLAAYQSEGAPSSLDQDYKGIPTKELLDRVLLRDMRAMSSGLKKYAVTLDRRGWRVSPGSVIRISDPRRGIANIVLRVAEIDDGNMVNGAIKIRAVVDVFGLPATGYMGVVDNGWEGPSRLPVAAPNERLIEMGYRDIFLKVGRANAEANDPTDAFVGTVASAPNGTTTSYDLSVKPEGGTYGTAATGYFTGIAIVTEDVGPLDTVISIGQLESFDDDNEGQAVLIGDEMVRVDAVDVEARTMTVTRGVADTIPQPHLADEIVWTIDDDLAADPAEYVSGETVSAQVLTRTSAMTLDPGEADELTLELTGRQGRPYPPAAVTVDGDEALTLTGEHAEPVIAWATRNRIEQQDFLIGYSEGPIAPEAGTTYTVRVYSTKGVLLGTHADIAEPTFTYTADMQAADGATGTVLVELESVRDGLPSWQHYRFKIVLKGGWGYGWGFSWGGS